MKLSKGARAALPSSSFGIPRIHALPIEDRGHAKAAVTYGISKMRASGKITAGEAAHVRSLVKQKYGIGKGK